MQLYKLSPFLSTGMIPAPRTEKLKASTGFFLDDIEISLIQLLTDSYISIGSNSYQPSLGEIRLYSL